MPPQTPMHPDGRGRTPMLRTPRGQFFIIAALVLVLLGGYTVRKVECEGPFPLRAYSHPYFGQLLDPKPDWGDSPGYSQPLEHPTEMGTTGFKLPAYSGWYRFLGDTNVSASVTAGQGIALCFYSGSYHCIDLDTGEERWQKTAQQYGENPVVVITPTTVLAYSKDMLFSFRLSDGKKMWVDSGDVPIAWDDGVIWAFHTEWKESYFDSTFDQVRLLSSDGGLVLRTFPVSSLQGYTSQNHIEPDINTRYSSRGCINGVFPDEDGTPIIAVKDRARIKVFSRDGTVRQYPAVMGNWPAALAITKKGLFVVEYESLMSSIDFATADYDTLWKNPARRMTARMIDLASGKELWRYTDRIILYKDNWGSSNSIRAGGAITDDRYNVFANDDTAFINGANGLVLLDINTGHVEGILRSSGEWVNPFIIGESGRYAVSSLGDYGNPIRPQNFKLRRPEQPYAIGGYNSPFVISKNTLLACTLTYPLRNRGPFGINHIFAVKLDDNGRPIRGKPTAYDIPASQKALVKEFYNDPVPINNSVLMTRAVDGGAESLAALAEGARQATPRQLDALVAYAKYLQSGYRSTEFDNILMQCLRKVDKSRLAARIPIWIRDSSLKGEHKSLLGLLAECDNGPAKAYLEKTYDSPPPSKLNVKPPPYRIPATLRRGNAEISDDKDHPGAWTDFVSIDGTRFVAYTSSGLYSQYDVYLGIDRGSDGWFDEILPTGLLDLSSLFPKRDPSREIVRLADEPEFPYAEPLKLTIDEDLILLSYMAPTVIASENDLQIYGRVSDRGHLARYITSRLSVKSLRKDTDADGLTDITEKLLLLNPNSSDTDADGIKDADDPAPNVNESTMGKSERGVRRAIQYSLNLVQGQTPIESNEEQAFPFNTLYFRFNGCSAAPVHINDHTRFICVRSGGNAQGNVQGDYVDWKETPTEVTMYKLIDWLREPGDSVVTSGFTYKALFNTIPFGAKYIVTIESPQALRLISMCSVGEELYPATVQYEQYYE